ncbi:MAG TPA: tetratricopeptide repeat protein [Spirochaetota bacterium]|nr:tetratricopeptide repeat protein [Spirochaetota bacterium]HPC40959.1 tetratricopeptide repeat protein [Spirochaetota bacterium]HPL18431.1 tetratricopeptide repeat protein [Spirochaetota bacterium]HQF08611.1 tetratricopeptide repeat protein [Spirochaetota bacterium]HQH97326.1 tetratricopeptide repeat protein [Spirochaetota bacterium]
MARKPRVRPERETKQIEIERNVIEQYLMDAKEFVREKRSLVIYSFLGLLVACVLVIAAVVIVDYVNTKNEKRFEKIMNDYAKYSSAGDAEKVKGVARDLRDFTDSTYFGFPHSAGYYALGNILFGQKEYREAHKYLVRYADKAPKTTLAPLALLKAAIALEEANDLKGALEVYKRLEDKYGDSIIADQIFYNAARVYAKNKDLVNSRNYYNKVIASFPESAFAEQAKKRLFLMGAL